jgi:hypothetical protein
VASFDTKESEVTLDVTISAPASGVSVVTQYNFCLPFAIRRRLWHRFRAAPLD